MSGERNNAKFIEQVEACRPGSADLRDEFAPAAERVAADPAARAYYERVQRADSRIAMAFHDVPVPADLAVRLLAPVEGGDFVSGVTDAKTDSVLPEVAELPRRARWKPVIRGLLVVAALMLVTVVPWTVTRYFTSYTEDECISAATEVDRELRTTLSRNWNTQLAAPTSRKPATQLYGSFDKWQNGWQHVNMLGDRWAVAYRFKHNSNAVLVVCDPRKSVSPTRPIPNGPPLFPQHTARQSAGTNVAMWQSGGLLHVLVVTGPIENYRAIVGRTAIVAKFHPQGLRNRYDG